MIPRGSVRAISFDYGHVLGGLDLDELAARLDRRDSIEAIRAAMPAAYVAHDDAVLAGGGHEGGWRALMSTLVAAAFGRPAGPASTEATVTAAQIAEAVEALWRAQPARNLWRFVPAEARALLDDLSRAAVPMVVTSNSEGRVAALLAEVGIADHFRAILDSGVLGIAKPDRRIFEIAAAALGAPVSAIVHVGDSEAADVLGALGAGAFAIRFDGFLEASAARPTRAHARTSRFAELRRILSHALAIELA
jgi:putative hydrolase of the HAD superfamily